MAQNSRKAIYRKHKKYRLIFNIVVSIVLMASIVTSALLGVTAYLTQDMKKGIISDDHHELGISSDVANKLPKNIINIALFGLDSRDREATNRDEALKGRSDAIIIVSINTMNNTIKMTSILRDSWVPIANKGYNKVNAAYSFGGAQKAIHTINSNYGLNITDYVSVSLYQLWNVIDIMGGIDIEITEMERKKLNFLAGEEGFNVTPVKKSGLVHLDGGQAMCYSRIRSDSEEIRVLRQHKVISCMFEKAKKMPASEYPSLLKKVLANVETSLSYDEIYSYAPMLAVTDLHLDHASIPGKEVVAEGGVFEDTRGGWVWKYDLNEAKKYIYSWIYDINE